MSTPDPRPTFAVAVVGAASLVGEMVVQVLEERGFPLSELHLLGSSRALGQSLTYRGREHPLAPLAGFDFSRVQIAFFCAGLKVSREHAPRAAESGCLVIDSTAAFRQEEDVPLIVPEINGHLVEPEPPRGILASPGSATLQLAVPLAALHAAAGLRSVTVSTYQSVSGAGRDAVKELAQQSIALLSGQGLEGRVPARPLAFICVPEIGERQADGSTVEETKLREETRKLLNLPRLPVSATCVRVPVFYGHAASVSLATERPMTPAEARAVLQQAPGVTLFADGEYPTAATAVANHDTVYVGRIRENSTTEGGLDLWIAIDNVRKGAATNSVQIAECWVRVAN